MSDNTFGDAIKAARVSRGLSLRAAAWKLHLLTGGSPNRSFLSNVENGHKAPPSAAWITELARLYEIDPEPLLAMAGRASSESVREALASPGYLALLAELKRNNIYNETGRWNPQIHGLLITPSGDGWTTNLSCNLGERKFHVSPPPRDPRLTPLEQLTANALDAYLESLNDYDRTYVLTGLIADPGPIAETIRVRAEQWQIQDKKPR